MLVIYVPMPTVSLNRYQRMHWAERKRLRDQYETIIRLNMSKADRVRRDQFRCVKIERYSARQLDHDNFVGGCKPLVDALIRARVIWDDSPDFLEANYIQCKASAKEARTVITVV